MVLLTFTCYTVQLQNVHKVNKANAFNYDNVHRWDHHLNKLCKYFVVTPIETCGLKQTCISTFVSNFNSFLKKRRRRKKESIIWLKNKTKKNYYFFIDLHKYTTVENNKDEPSSIIMQYKICPCIKHFGKN